MHTIRSLFANLWLAFIRFPLTIISAFVAFVFIVLYQHIPESPSNMALHNKLLRITLEAIAGISVFYAFHVYAENKNLDWAKKLGFTLLGFCLLALHYYSIPIDIYNFGFNYLFRFVIIIFCFHLIISFSLYFNAKDVDSFWQYNVYIFSRFITGIGFSLVLFIGVGGLLYAADKLFALDINSKIYTDVFAFFILVITTFYFTSNLPLNTHDFEKKIEYKDLLRILIQYILLFIVFGYALILALYSGKIIINDQAPNVYVAVPILIFGALGLLTYLLAYPIRYGKYYWITSFCKHFFYVLLPFLVLYFISLGADTWNNGLTEFRYLGILLGTWLTFIAIYLIVSKRDNIIIVPVSLFAILILANFGPWSMYEVSAYNQFVRAKSVLENNKLLINGKIEPKHTINLSKDDQTKLYASLEYLYTHGEIDKLRPLLHEKDLTALEKIKKEGFNEQYVGSLIGNSISIYSDGNEVDGNTLSFITDNSQVNNFPQATKGFAKMMRISCSNRSYLTEQEMPDSLSQRSIPILLNNHLILTNGKDTFLNERLENYLNNLDTLAVQINESKDIIKKTINDINLPYRQIETTAENLSYQTENYLLVPEFIQCDRVGKSLQLRSINAYIFFN